MYSTIPGRPARTERELLEDLVGTLRLARYLLPKVDPVPMKCFLLMTWQSEEDSNQAAYALVGIDANKAKDILAKKELFQMARAKDQELYQLSFWDRRCYFYNMAAGDDIENQLGGEKAMESFIDDGKCLVSESFVLPDEYETRTDADQIVLTEDGFFWRSNSHHGCGRFETRPIKFEEILGI